MITQHFSMIKFAMPTHYSNEVKIRDRESELRLMIKKICEYLQQESTVIHRMNEIQMLNL